MWFSRTGLSWVVAGALTAGVLSTACIPTVQNRPTTSVPPADWLKPGRQTVPSASMRRLAVRLRGADAEQTIRRIYQWMRANHKRFRGDKGGVLRRRTAAELFAKRNYSGCGDWGLVLATLFRAAGLPTVFIEAIQKDWAVQKRQGTGGGSYQGHVFLEVRTAKGWVLVDSTKPYLWRKYNPAEKNLPRDYYVLAKGRDSWSIGIHNQFQLQWAMDHLMENTPDSRYRDVSLPRTELLTSMVVFGMRDLVQRIRRGVGSAAVRGLAPRRLGDWLDDCKKCEALALLPADLAPREVKGFTGVVGQFTKLGPFGDLVRSTPRWLSLPRGRLCLYVRGTTAELLKIARRHSNRPLNATTCQGP